jgi:hypothetical protein
LQVSLDEAVEIHAKVLKYRYGRNAPFQARLKARHCATTGDREGHSVWEKVAATAEQFLIEPTAFPDAGRN